MRYLLYKINAIMRWLLIERAKFFERLSFYCKLISETSLAAHYSIVEKEIELAKIREKTNVLHIGGGIPYTAAIIAHSTGAGVTSLEMDSKIVDTARRWIKNRKLEDKIKVIFANGTNFNVSDFDVIILSLNVAPKEKILSNIFNTCGAKTKIIYRSARRPLDKIYEDKDILGRYKSHIEGHVYQQGSFVGGSYLLAKNGKME